MSQQLDKAEKVLIKSKSVAKTPGEKSEVEAMRLEYKTRAKKEFEFAKNMFTKGSEFYEDKPLPPPTPVDPNVDQEELEYLKTLNIVQWLFYPFLKAGWMILCRRKLKAS